MKHIWMQTIILMIVFAGIMLIMRSIDLLKKPFRIQNMKLALAELIAVLSQGVGCSARTRPRGWFLAPVLIFVPSFIAFALLTLGRGISVVDSPANIFLIILCSELSVAGMFLAGWTSRNAFSFVGAYRSAAQMIGYELPRILSWIPPMMIAGSIKITGIHAVQTGYWFGIMPKWFVLYPGIGQLCFSVFMIASIMQCGRLPFDTAAADDDAAGGYAHDYAGVNYLLITYSRYAYLLTAGVLAAFIFTGGAAGTVMLIAAIFVLCMLIATKALPRLTVQQMISLGWQYIIPAGFIGIIGYMIIVLKHSWQ